MNWNKIQEMYLELFNIPPRVVDFIAIDEIIKLCVTGLSNEKIANLLNFDDEYIKVTLLEFLGFFGWEKDLDINPLFVYNKCDGVYEKFVQEIKLISPLVTEKEYQKSFNLCRKYKEIRKEIDKHYDG